MNISIADRCRRVLVDLFEGGLTGFGIWFVRQKHREAARDACNLIIKAEEEINSLRQEVEVEKDIRLSRVEDLKKLTSHYKKLVEERDALLEASNRLLQEKKSLESALEVSLNQAGEVVKVLRSAAQALHQG